MWGSHYLPWFEMKTRYQNVGFIKRRRLYGDCWRYIHYSIVTILRSLAYVIIKGVFAYWTFNRILSLETTERYNVYIVGIQIKQPSIPKYTHLILNRFVFKSKMVQNLTYSNQFNPKSYYHLTIVFVTTRILYPNFYIRDIILFCRKSRD